MGLDGRKRVVGSMAASAAALAAAAVALFLLGHRYLSWPSAFNSDDLLCTALVDDVLTGRDIHEWHLPGAPYLFPDMVLLAPCRLAAPNLVVEFLAYHFLFWSLAAGLLAWLGRLVGLPADRAFSAAAAGVALLAAAHLHPAYGRGPGLVHPGSHVGLLLVGLFLLAATMQALRDGYGIGLAALCLLIGGAGAFSDRLLLIQFVAPTGLALGVLLLRRRLSVRRAVVHAAVLGGVVAVSMLLRVGLVRLGFRFLRVEDWIAGPRFEDVGAMAGIVGQILQGQTLLMVLLPLHLVLALAVACLPTPTRSVSEGPSPMAAGREFLGWALFLSPWCNIGALLLLGQGQNPAIERYLLPCWLLPLLCPVLLAGLLPWQRLRAFAAAAIPAVVVLFVGWRAAGVLPAVQRSQFEVPYPPLAQALDRLVRERGPLRGLAGFWEARSLSLLTRERVPVRPLNFVGEPWFHACNPAAFVEDVGDGAPPGYQFIIATDRPPSAAPPQEILLAHYGPPKEKIAVGQDAIWIYDGVRSSPLERFLNAERAEQLRRRQPFVGPAEPACLARPKANRTPAQGRGTAAVPLGKALEVRFDPPVSGGLLDVSADHAADCVLEFFAGTSPTPLAELRVPAVPWTGAAYDSPGLQSRLLAVPAALRGRCWDRVVIHPRSRHGATVGHVLVLPGEPPSVAVPATPRQLRLEAENLLPVIHDLSDPQMRASVTTVTDDRASGGKARRGAPPWRQAVAETPALTLSPGRYRIDFALRAEGSPTADAAILRVAAPAPCSIDRQRTLRVAELAGKSYRKESLTVDIVEEVDDVHISVCGSGKAAVLVDYVELHLLAAGEGQKNGHLARGKDE
jgi:hypothetical protein